MQNDFIERKNGSLRPEILNAYVFTTMDEVRDFCEEWCIDYNTERPNKSLGYLPPAMFDEQWYQRSKYAPQPYPQMVTENSSKIEGDH